MSIAPLSTTAPRLTGAATAGRKPPVWRPLLAKELRLQRSNLMFLAGVLLFWGLLRLANLAPERQVGAFKMADIVSALHLVGVQSCLLIFLPLMFGATAVAGERQLGVLDWQLAMPRARTRQMLAKAAVALGLAAFTGGGCASVLNHLLVGAAESNSEGTGRDLFSILTGTIWPGSYAMFLAAAGLYTSTFARDATRALIATLPLLVLTGVVIFFADPALVLLPPLGFIVDEPAAEHVRFGLMSALLVVLAARSYDPFGSSPRVALGHLPAWAAAVFALTLATVHVVRGVDLQTATSGQTIQPTWEYRTLVADAEHSTVKSPTSKHAWKTGGAERNPYTLALIAGEYSNWKETLTYPDDGTRFSSELYKSPEGRLVGRAADIRPYRPDRIDLAVGDLGTWFDAEIGTWKTRQFPGALGALVEFRHGHAYGISSEGGTFLAGKIPLLTLRTTSDHAHAYLRLARGEVTGRNVQGYVPGRDHQLDVHASHWTGGARPYILQGLQTLPGATSRPFMAFHVHGWPKHMATGDMNEDTSSTSSRAKIQVLYHLDDRSQRAQIVDTAFRDNMFHSPYLVSQDGDWFARPRDHISADLQLHGLTAEGKLTGTSWTLPSNGKRQSFGQRYVESTFLQKQSVHGGGRYNLPISSDGKYLACIRAEHTGNAFDAAQPVLTGWYEVVVLNLENGHTRTLGGFPLSDSYIMHSAAVPRLMRQRPHEAMQRELNHHISALHEPLLAWSPGRKLAVLNGADLYLFDPATSEPTFTHVDIDRTVSHNLAFWDDKTLLLTGDRSIWKLEGPF